MIMEKEKIISQIKDRLLNNALEDYDNALACANDYTMKHDKYKKRWQELSDERIFLMQDYETVLYDIDFGPEDLNFNYEDVIN